MDDAATGPRSGRAARGTAGGRSERAPGTPRREPSGAPRLEVELTWRGSERFEVTGRSGAAGGAPGADRDSLEAGVVREEDRGTGPQPEAPSAETAPAGPVLDGEAAAGLSPMETLLAALGSCGGVDVVEILRKGRQDLRAVTIRLEGERRVEVPRRFTRIRVEVAVRGPVDPSRAERAVALAFEKYCSVRSSLDPGMPVATAVTVLP